MPHPELQFDRDVSKQDAMDLTNADAVAGFFAHLGYPVDQRIEQSPANLDLTAESTLQPIRRVELLASLENELQVYLFEVNSVTIAHRKALVRKFGVRSGNFLLVITSDYERIDFVLVETYEPPGAQEEGSPFRSVTYKVRPRAHTIERRKPTAVDLRVLRRFTWTEEDGYAQYRKLLSAFDVATWSEPEFNNRALFSDHYLKSRLPELDDWKDDPKPAYRGLSNLFRSARRRFQGQELNSLRQSLLDPALETLNFTLGESPKDKELLGRPLLGPDGATRLAWCLDFPWGRNLDAKDSLRDPATGEENPSVVVVELLEHADVEVPWIILTNGQIWRLYGRQAHSRATNYYEIDVEEVVSPTSETAASPQKTFRYFWLMFRRRAFEKRSFHREGRAVSEPLLTHLWVESGEYAKRLGERLKDKIFEDVFEILARGFLASRSSTGAPTQEELDEAFEGTLTFLYRVLFLLYAESRDLLPVREVRGYYEASLKRIKREIAEKADSALSQVDEKLEKAYGSREEPTLYRRLVELFEIVDRGSKKLNVPMYNGGLFVTDPAKDDPRPEARAARFLKSHHVADLPLTRVLDRLARDEDEKSSALVPIDYKSLGVRQLGSIYEGLLEFRLRVAAEPMAIVKGKKTEEVVPLTEAQDKDLTILRHGRARDAPERLLDTGEIYLENDKQERRATGSYYTPDFVVEYIVRKTVGPVLNEKLEALRPRLREAEGWNQKRTSQAPGKGESAAKYEFGPAVEARWQELVHDVFDLKIVDPAMGSGHFLVEAVDFVTDEILRFLSAFPWNPVFAHLQHLRETILREMEAQDITIDADRLTDTHLLKRHVLKRCIFGVDLNPMAVELAKVSLWLDCFTLGAPLSFLDHHLRRGNSILGVTVEEAREVIERQLSILGSRFAGLQLATLSMIQIGTMADVTSAQVAASRDAFDNATQELTPYLRLLHLYFGHLLRVTAKKKTPETPSILLELIRAPETEDLFTDLPVEKTLARLTKEEQKLVRETLAEAGARGFFHWQLEFPEVFFSVRPGTERKIELDPEGGFDAVVGNPPWVRQEALKAHKPVLKELFSATYDSIADVYVYVLTRGLQVARPGGRLGMILQGKWFKSGYGQALREHLTSVVTPLEVIDFGHAPLFEDADTFPCVLLVEKEQPPEDKEATVDFFKVEDLRVEEFPGLDLDEYGATRRGPVLLRRLRRDGWELLPKEQGDLMEKLRKSGPTLAEYVGQSPQYGIKTGYNPAFLIDQETRDRLVAEDPASEDVFKPYLRGQDIQRWVPEWAGKWMIRLASSQNVDWPWSNAKNEAEAEDIFQEAYPALHKWMKAKEKRLRRRSDKGDFWWELRSCSYYHLFEQSTIVYKDLSFHSAFSFTRQPFYTNDLCFIIPSTDLNLLAILNSSLLWWYLTNVTLHGKTEALRLKRDRLMPAPIARTKDSSLADITENLITSNQKQSAASLSMEVQLHQKVFDLYGLTPDEIQVIRNANVARDPLRLAEKKLAKLERKERSAQ